jgi:trigger factor
MQVSVEVINSVERRLTVVVPAGQVEEAYNKQINEAAKGANIKGFRPGKAPISYIQQRFGDTAYKEAVSEVIQKTLSQAITEQKLRPVAMPRVEPKVALLNQPLEYVAIVEIFPEIGELQLKADKIEKIQTDITDADVDYVIEQLRKQQAQWTVVERPAQEKDRVVIDYYTIFEGKENKAHKVVQKRKMKKHCI